MANDVGGFLVSEQNLEWWWKNILDPTMELVQVPSEWEIEGKLTVWEFRKKIEGEIKNGRNSN